MSNNGFTKEDLQRLHKTLDEIIEVGTENQAVILLAMRPDSETFVVAMQGRRRMLLGTLLEAINADEDLYKIVKEALDIYDTAREIAGAKSLIEFVHHNEFLENINKKNIN